MNYKTGQLDPTTNNAGFAIGRAFNPCTVVIGNCKTLIVRVGEIEMSIDLENVPLDKVDTIIINGHKFERSEKK